MESLLQINKDGIITKYKLERELTEKLCRKSHLNPNHIPFVTMATLITASQFLWQRKEAHKYYSIETRLSCFNNKTDNSALIEKTKGTLFSSTFKVICHEGVHQ